MSNVRGLIQRTAPVAALLVVAVCGCELPPPTAPQTLVSQPVPSPVNLLLPQKIRIHSFTRTGELGEDGDGVRGIDVRIQAMDAYDDATKAFGKFRFELFRFRPNSSDPKGPRLAVWTVDVGRFEENRRHWNSIMRTYQFKLGWDEPVPVGQKLVLTATFDSPFSNRLFHEYVFVSGDSGPGPS